MFRTDDKGGSWKRLGVDLPEKESFQSLAAHREGQVVVALTQSGETYVSRDGGDSWQTEDLTGGRAVLKLAFLGDDLVFQPQQEGTLYAVRDASGKPQQPEPLKQSVSAWDAAGSTIGVIVMGDDRGLSVSRDAGRTWEAIHKDLYGGTVVVTAGPTGDQILHQSSATTRLDSGDGAFQKVGRPGDTVADFCALPEGGWLTADRVHGLYSTTDWKRFHRVGVPAASVTTLTVAEEAVLAGTKTGLFCSPLPVGGPDWKTPEGLLSSGNHVVDLDVSAEDPSLVWRTRRINLECTAERSVDAGQTWQPRGTWPDAIFALHIHPLDPDRVMHSFGGALSTLTHRQMITKVIGNLHL
ncbi:hypothetical protein AB0945_43055 [Streptomyces sp. NPDC005474]|uniref:WD40/YVTN/BNR-like repeat-containing protein n=1 Tax=Streptomyces sp. NPDC005474 TaxID=3154878 RepID=UPI0034543523